MTSDETVTDAAGASRTTNRRIANTVSRRQFIAGSSASALALTAGCLGESASSSGESVTMLLTPGTPEDTRRRYKPIENMVRGEVDGIDLEVTIPQDYTAVKTALTSEQAEIGMEDITYISNPDVMDLFGTKVEGGSAFYFSMMVKNEGRSDIQEPADLEEQTVAFADRLSTSGSIFAVYALKEAGLDVGGAPDGEPVDFEGTWSSHKNALEELGNEGADAACTWTGNGMPHISKEDIPSEVEEKDSFVGTADTEEPHFTAFWWSFPIPKEPIYARKSWESEKKQEIKDVLVNSDEELVNEYAPSDYNEEETPFTTIRDTSLDAYEPVIERLNELDIELGK